MDAQPAPTWAGFFIPKIRPAARLTPHHYFLSSDPLNNGMHWGHAGLLAALTVAFLATAVWAFDHRDLRQG